MGICGGLINIGSLWEFGRRGSEFVGIVKEFVARKLAKTDQVFKKMRGYWNMYAI